MKDAIHLHRLPAHVFVEKVAYAAIFHFLHVGIHDHELGVGLRLQFGRAGAMIVMRVADKNDLHIFHVITQLFHAAFNQGEGFFVARVNQDVAFVGRDEVTGQVIGSDVKQIFNHTVRRKGLIPGRVK